MFGHDLLRIMLWMNARQACSDHAPPAPFDRHEPVWLMNGAEKAL
jgi:hypothetical protein